MSSMNLMRLCRIGYLAFVALVGSYILTQGEYSLGFKALLVAPLLLPIPGILAGKPYTYAWSGFILCLYLCHGLTLLVIAPEARVFASIESILALTLIAAQSYYARMRVREMGTSLKQIKAQQS
ncbi:DUF2069 domain-containing protein [Paraferrimonas sedimenticola]|uniref:DUF2069 domain-containing protein n=1 Tax=Paraferrimonas sedimenticola TaxID=375674 RepID=A0AA37RNS9_9GAMM|nr:DUF2069 domain-containing protein [Paraferrimonas sedimenticola]GLP94771.1 hypothetical protein GCM10007895_00770 [Paraferrimonas sedimenticola]